MPQQKPLTKARDDLRKALEQAHQGRFEPCLQLACRKYRLIGESRDSDLRIWDASIMRTPERFFEWLEAVQMAYRDTGIMTAGYSECVLNAILYWYGRTPRHAYWAERWRQFAEMPEFAPWAEDINDKMRAVQLGLDPVLAIA